MFQRSASKILKPSDLPNQQPQDHILVSHKLNKSRNSVYQVFLKDHKRNYALKFFPHKETDQKPESYLHEARFSTLDHPNIIQIIKTMDDDQLRIENKVQRGSYIVMELAPFGNFKKYFKFFEENKDMKLIRTYFHQLIEGLEYLHTNKIAHLDLKCENLLLTKDYKLKIADFDCSRMEGDSHVRTLGTLNYRAPEIKSGNCKAFQAADVYSAGVTLFILRFGIFPYLEDIQVGGVNFFQLLMSNPRQFWDVHEEMHGSLACPQEFKNLFEGMIRYDPRSRFTLEKVRGSTWYQGPVYSDEDLAKIMKDKIKIYSRFR